MSWPSWQAQQFGSHRGDGDRRLDGLDYGVVGGRPVLTFFLASIVVAGIYGAVTVSRRILLIQALPAAIGAALLWLA